MYESVRGRLGGPGHRLYPTGCSKSLVLWSDSLSPSRPEGRKTERAIKLQAGKKFNCNSLETRFSPPPPLRFLIRTKLRDTCRLPAYRTPCLHHVSDFITLPDLPIHFVRIMFLSISSKSFSESLLLQFLSSRNSKRLAFTTVRTHVKGTARRSWRAAASRDSLTLTFV